MTTSHSKDKCWLKLPGFLENSTVFPIRGVLHGSVMLKSYTRSSWLAHSTPSSVSFFTLMAKSES